MLPDDIRKKSCWDTCTGKTDDMIKEMARQHAKTFTYFYFTLRLGIFA